MKVEGPQLHHPLGAAAVNKILIPFRDSIQPTMPMTTTPTRHIQVWSKTHLHPSIIHITILLCINNPILRLQVCPTLLLDNHFHQHQVIIMTMTRRQYSLFIILIVFLEVAIRPKKHVKSTHPINVLLLNTGDIVEPAPMPQHPIAPLHPTNFLIPYNYMLLMLHHQLLSLRHMSLLKLTKLYKIPSSNYDMIFKISKYPTRNKITTFNMK